MSTGYGWEGIRQICATLLGARHVPERLCGRACLQRGAITSVRPLAFTLRHSYGFNVAISAVHNSCLGGAAVRRRTRDRKVAGSTPDRGAAYQVN